MGIKGLLHLLQPYATRVEFAHQRLPQENDAEDPLVEGLEASTAPSEKFHIAVIDGPALAYHAYYRALARRVDSCNALEAMPNYAEVNQIALEYLDILESHGIRIRAIFFDGALPATKQKVRLERLTGYAHQLENYRCEHNKPSVDFRPGGVGSRTEMKTTLYQFSPGPIPAMLKKLPALPFLVPSVIETLQSSKYREITSVIAGEADSFCAAVTKRTGAMVITSDSDLLVYDIGTHGTVLLLNAISPSIPSTDKCLRASIYESAKIAQRLGLKSLHPLAFAVSEDPAHLLNRQLEKALRLQADISISKNYQNFLREYTLPSCDKDNSTSLQMKAILRSVDPRLSEWIHGSKMIDAIPNKFSTFDMYLPVLIEDPRRASAWDVGKDIRRLAYSILAPSSETINLATSEITRRGNGVVGKPIQHQTYIEMGGYLIDNNLPFLQQVNDSPPALDTLTESEYLWRARGAYLLYDHLGLDVQSGQSLNEYNLLLHQVRPATNDWKFIHLAAQCQAALYSFRLLKQCLDICVALERPKPANVQTMLLDMQQDMKGMPTIANLFDAREWWDSSLVAPTTSVGTVGGKDSIAYLKKKKRKKRKQQDKDSSLQNASLKAAISLSNNKYSALLQDN